MTDQSASYWTYLLPVLLVALVVRRNLRARRLKVERLWLFPLIILVATGMALLSRPPTSAAAIAGIALGVVLGAVAGWYRGRLTHITVDPQTHDVTSKASMVGMLLILVLMAVRGGLRFYLADHAASKGLGVYAPMLADALLAFAAAMMSVQRLEMWQRARGLLAQAKAARSVGTVMEP